MKWLILGFVLMAITARRRHARRYRRYRMGGRA